MKVRSLSGGVSISFLLSLATTLVYMLLFVESVEGKVRCYVCSWHSPAHHGGQNMTDTCSHYNFNETYTHTIECDGGCEAVSIRKSKNENIINFYKNCKSASKSLSKDECTSMEDESFQYVTTCECSSDYCNAADGGRTATGYCFGAALIAPYILKLLATN